LSESIDIFFKYLINIANVIVFIYNIPQVYKTIKTKKAGDLSFWFLFLRLVSSIIWVAYSFYYKLTDVLISWILTGSSSLILLIYKYKYRYNSSSILPVNNLNVNNGK
jgi:uncharacterized protein with PQ loop repeat